jgi:hypothetical protein
MKLHTAATSPRPLRTFNDRDAKLDFRAFLEEAHVSNLVVFIGMRAMEPYHIV